MQGVQPDYCESQKDVRDSAIHRLEDTTMLNDVREQGAAAARAGLTVWDSPFLRADAMPAHTGEPFPAWCENVRAWEEGWHQAAAARLETRGVVVAAWLRALRAASRLEKAEARRRLLFAATLGAPDARPNLQNMGGSVPRSFVDD